MKNTVLIWCSELLAVSVHKSIFYTDSSHAAYINLAAKLTESPITEYSLLEPLVPTTPANTVPVTIPIEQLHDILGNSYLINYAVNIALTESF